MALKFIEMLRQNIGPAIQAVLDDEHAGAYASAVEATFSKAAKFEFDNLVMNGALVTGAEDALLGEAFPWPSAQGAYVEGALSLLSEYGVIEPHRLGVFVHPLRGIGKEDERVLFFMAMVGLRENEYFFPPTWLTLDKTGYSLRTFKGVMRDQDSAEEKESIKNTLQMIIQAALCSLLAINSKDFTTALIAPSRAVKEKRARLKRDPIVEYHVVRIKPELRKAYQDAAVKAAHASPRFHFRRGHLRTIEAGRRVYVSPCFVGSIENGRIEKHYEVTA